MTQQINDGGPAYPAPTCSQNQATGETTVHESQGGMSLRDYFAAKAPPPPRWWMESYKKVLTNLDTVADHVAQWNYTYADGMLRARQQ